MHRPVADERDIERAAAVLTGARRLVIVAGDGAAASGAGPEVLALAEALAAPVATTLGARGIIPTTHRLSAGVAGSYSAPPANRIVHGADLVLFIGCDTGDQVTLNWTDTGDRHQDRADRGRSARNRPQLPEHDRPRRRSEGDRWPASTRSSAGRPATRSSPRKPRGSSPIGAPGWRRWSRRTRRRSPSSGCAPRSPAPCRRDGVLVADTGYSGIWTGTMIELNGAGQSYLRAAGSLGWAFPASLGAQCAAGPRKVLCFTGDGGFYYHLAELETARRCRIPATVVVNNNSGFGQNLTGVRRISGNRPGRGEELIRFGPTDFTEVARSFGVRGIRVEQPAGDRAGAATGARRRRAGRRRCRHRSRTARSGSLVAAAAAELTDREQDRGARSGRMGSSDP